MENITPDKLELLRVALPKGLSAGDSGLAEFPKTPPSQPMNWPQFQSLATESKIYSPTPIISQPATDVQQQKSLCALEVYKRRIDGVTEIWVASGLVAGELPTGFDLIEGKSIASGGSGDVWAEVVFDENDGTFISANVSGGGTIPEDTNDTSYYPLGHYEYSSDSITVVNYGCGSVDFVSCRKWFSVEPPFYKAILSR